MAPSAPRTSSTPSAGNTYLGYAAHCAGTGSSTDTDGCTTKSLPLGELTCARAHAGLAGLALVPGTEPLDPQL